uniref:Uncharacterized protein n=1 Tax=Setaria digitata TaxID=48799 RepID=A0A915PPM1_9BILA
MCCMENRSKTKGYTAEAFRSFCPSRAVRATRDACQSNMLAPIITKDMNPFPSQNRKARSVRMCSQGLESSKITGSVSRNQDAVMAKSFKLKPTSTHSSSSIGKPTILPSIVEGVEMPLNTVLSCHCTYEDDGSRNILLPTASTSTLVMIPTTTTAVATTASTSPLLLDSTFSSTVGRGKTTKDTTKEAATVRLESRGISRFLDNLLLKSRDGNSVPDD